MQPRKPVSIIIPVFNEERRLGSTLRSVTCHLSEAWDHEIVVVDDGSEDRTAAVARECASADGAIRLVQAGSHRGKGYCVRLGMRAATKSFRLVCDADLSTPIEELEKLYAWGERGYDLVIGSRAHADARIELRQSLFRETLGKSFNLVVRALFDGRFRDTQCGFKLFSENAAS
ncbi:MAG: glycosyltransferase, partial [Deltaproteobacteria bacterium]